ncbi:metallophosphoesterase [Thermococcus sp.]|uniref:metallophosphoesterase family protein n=1 Tax=Thermococcus sp. TaxID=35749 RepID=UPI0025F2F34C|nr:metallophosphoesterase [Thermococcus sp.]
MRRVALAFLLAFIVLAAGCVSSGGHGQTGTTASSHKPSGGVNFSAYGRGQILQNWAKFVNVSTVYVSPGYEDLAKHYFPNARILPASQYSGGVAVLSPRDGRSLLRGRPILITVRDYFGYIAYKMGFEFVGPDKGIFVAFNKGGRSYFVFTGTSRAGAGAALEYAMKLKNGTRISVGDVMRRGEFEGILLKVIGDTNWNGIPDRGEHWYLKPFNTEAPFIYYWRVVEGENVTVKGGFIRFVNGSTVYIRALGFNVSVLVKNPNGAKLTYVIENINPNYVEVRGRLLSVDTGGTTIIVNTSYSRLSIVPKNVSTYRVLAFGDHRPPSGVKPPAVFLKIRDDINGEDGAFVLDGGDMVYTGTTDQWAALMAVWNWNKPIFVAPGNHGYQGDGINIFHRLFGPSNYAFSLGKYRYIIINDVAEGYGLSNKTFVWLEGQLKAAKEAGQRSVLVLHVPPIDPRPNGHHAMNPTDAKRLLGLMREYNAFGIFSHIHMFWYGERDGVQILITGGGGAPLYAPPDQGGFYHYVRLTMESNGTILVKAVKVAP